MEHVTVQGVSIPAIGLGTWRMTGPTCRRAVSTALDLGYRRIDTAQAYGNERAVGAAIDVADVDRGTSSSPPSSTPATAITTRSSTRPARASTGSGPSTWISS